MIKYRITKADGWVQIGAAGVVVAQAISGSPLIAISAAMPDVTDPDLAHFILRPDNENLFQMEIAAPLWAYSVGSSTIMVSQDGA